MKHLILFILYIVFSLNTQAEYQLKLTGKDYLPVISVESVMKVLIQLGIKHPKVVLAQGILETGHFKSNVCIKHNNLFGLTKDNGKYYHFDNWIESVAFYAIFIQSRYKPPNENYYQFLKRIRYAKDKKYILKLKKIVNGYNTRIQKIRLSCH